MNLNEKIEELSKKYELPDDLIKGAIKLEQEKLVLQNRRMTPKLVELICKFVEAEEAGAAHNAD